MKALKICRVVAVVLALLIGWQAVECTVLTAKIVKASGNNENADEGSSYAGEGGSLGAVDKLLLDYAESMDGSVDDQVTDVIEGKDVFTAGEDTAVYEGGVGAEEYADYYMVSETETPGTPVITTSTLQASQVTIKVEDKDSTAASKLLLSPAKPDLVLYKSTDDSAPKPANFTAAEIGKVYTKLTSAVTGVDYNATTGSYVFGDSGEGAKELSKGHYILLENSAPTGYVAGNFAYYFYIDEKGLQYTGVPLEAADKSKTNEWPTKVEGATINETIQYTRIPGKITITRNDTLAKSYATFKITHKEGTTEVVDVASITVDANGVATVLNDDNGKPLKWEVTYEIKEISTAKAGYIVDSSKTYYAKITPQDATLTSDGMYLESQVSVIPTVGSTNVQLVVTNFDDGIKNSGSLLFPSAAVKGMTITVTQGSTSTDYVTDESGMISLTLASATQTAATSYTVTPKQIDPYFPIQPFTMTMGTDGRVSVSSGSTARKTGTIGSTKVPEIDVVSSTPSAGSPAVINIHPSVTKISFSVYVNTAESIDTSYRAFTPSGEYGVPDSVSFTMYGTYTSGTNVSDPVKFTSKSGKSITDGSFTTDSGVATIYAMPYRSADNKEYYYIKYKSKSGATNMTEASSSTDLIRLSMPSTPSGTCTLVAGSTNKTLTAPTTLPDKAAILGTIKHGSISFKVVDHNDTAKGLAGAKFEIYRLYEGDDSDNDDGRGDAKINAEDDEYDDSADSGSSSVYTYSLSQAHPVLDGILSTILAKDPFALRAYAAVATSTYPTSTNNEWQKLGAGFTSASDGTVTINGLVPGQRYLIRQTAAPSGYSVTKNPIVILTRTSMGSTTNANINKVTDYNGAQNSTTSAVRQSGATMSWLQGTGTATSSKSGTSSTIAGSGTAAAAGSGAGDARGSATGDESKLWLHLVVMLIAFDALVADLLFISRRKKVYAPVRNDRKRERER